MEDCDSNFSVFVYGTLRRGYRNSFFMEEIGGIFLDEADTKDAGFFLATIGNPQDMQAFPVLCAGEDRVRGELYMVDKNGLLALDSFEHSPIFYRRVKIPINHVVHDTAWVYGGTPKLVDMAYENHDAVEETETGSIEWVDI